ncbi:SUN domain-containing protein 2 isoform X1 [Frankliniella occidentalis]|uniref:SUN domain-containing protein 2 isoform X1 n=1 Tax=Frankliniella occidentalis TaxID=133901 RepID=A0A9C6WWK1_FRAOC|nr:SUN domain-containing protein 2 isoform X1 [Frankliniella occidentalis]
MSDRVLRSRVRNGPTSLSLSEDWEKVRFSAGRRRQKEVQPLNTVAQERLFKQDQRQPLKKRVVFSSRRYSSDDLPNGKAHAIADAGSPIVGILKQSPLQHESFISDVIDEEVDVDEQVPSTPKAQRGRPRTRGRPAAAAGGRGRVSSKHASFTEEASASPWQSASSSILAALALSVSPLARKRAKQAEAIAKEEEAVRRAVHFYKSSGEWWNVFPKTDYSYSRMSSFHREISPGVPTLPNMSRPGLHTEIHHQNIAKKLLYSDIHGSDSDEVDDARSSFRFSQPQNHPSVWKTTLTLIMTTLTSILTIFYSKVRSIAERASTIFSTKRKPAYVFGNQVYHPNRQQPSGVVSRIWLSFLETVSNTYHWIRRTSVSNNRIFNGGQQRRNSWLIPILLLIPLILLTGLWRSSEDHQSSISQITSAGLKGLGNWIWTVLQLPFELAYAIVSLPWHFSSNFMSILYDIILCPLILLQSIFDILCSFSWNIVSLFQMLLAPILSLKMNLWDTSSEHVIQGSESYLDLPTGIDNDGIKALLNSALQKQEESILLRMSKTHDGLRADFLSKMAAQEKQLRAELEAKEGLGQQLNLKVTHLQDELRRLRRRFSTCCRGSEPLPFDAVRGKLWEELKKLLSSPEGLVLLGAAAVYNSPADKSQANIPQFNDTEIRAWISSSFLDKDDFEKALANMTKYFNEELERRSANMMAATAEEINARIARQSQIHLAQISKLQSELSTSFGYQTSHFQNRATSSVTDSTLSVDESIVRKIVDAAIAVYDADKTGMADYALESQGGQVVSTRCTETYQVKSPTLSVFGVPLWYPSNSPRTVIQPGMHPGECWAFVGSQGYLVIQLSHRIRVKGFTYEHISPVLLPTGKMNSAPKEFSIYGLSTEGDPTPVLLGDYHYLQNSTSMQFFPVQQSNAPPLQLIEIQVKSNHGNINYTCMYRFRVHGTIA